MANIFETKRECSETDMTVSATTIPPDNARQVRQGKLDPFAPKNSVVHPERPRYGHDY